MGTATVVVGQHLRATVHCYPLTSSPTDTCSKDKAEKDDRAKAEDVRMKAMEKLSQTKKRELKEDGEDKPKRRRRRRRRGRRRRRTGDAMEYLKEIKGHKRMPK